MAMTEESLKKKTIKGVAWSGIDNVARFGVSFVVSIVLARLLTPDDYGLIGITAVFTAICQTLVNAGFTNALIRKKDASDSDYNTAFIVNLAISLTLYVVIFFGAPFIADFFGRQELIDLIRVLSLGMIIGALALVQQTRLTKRIDFKAQTKITIIASIVSGCIGIFLALLGFGVWALVAQQLLSQTIRTSLLWYVNKWLPKFMFSLTSFHVLFGFGWKMMLSGLIDTVWGELNQVVVGKIYSPATLGQFTRARQFSSLFSSNLTGVIQRVTFPVLSNIQNDKELMVVGYRKMIKTTMFVSAIGMFFLGAISEPLLLCLIGSKWHEAATYLPLICISSSLYPLHAMNLNMLQVQGRSDLFLDLEVVKKAIAVGPLLIGAFVGIIPMLYSNIFVSVISFFLNSYYSSRLLGYSSFMQIKDVASSFGFALVIALSVFFLKCMPVSCWIVLLLQFVVGSFVFCILCRYTCNEQCVEIKNILLTYFQRNRS